MPCFTKTSLATACILGAGSGAFPGGQVLASNNYDRADWAQVYVAPSVGLCPTLEGYPDCHPDSLPSWGGYSASSKYPASKHSSHQRRP